MNLSSALILTMLVLGSQAVPMERERRQADLCVPALPDAKEPAVEKWEAEVKPDGSAKEPEVKQENPEKLPEAKQAEPVKVPETKLPEDVKKPAIYDPTSADSDETPGISQTIGTTIIALSTSWNNLLAVFNNMMYFVG